MRLWMKAGRQVAAVLGLTVAALGAQAAETVTLRVAHFWPPQALSQRKVLEPWCAQIAQESKGGLKCQIYPAMQLGGTPAQLIDQVADGVADIVWTLPGYTAGRYPAMEAFELPFMTTQAQGASRAAWLYAQRYAQKDFARVKPLAFHVHDAGHVHNNQHPIRTLADFQGLKMRAPTRLTNKMLAAFGATPVAMPLPTLTESLSKGVIDGYVLPWEVIPTVKLHEVTRYHSEGPADGPSLYTAVFIIAMNPAKYDSLSPELKAVIDRNSGLAWSAHIGQVWDESAMDARARAVGHGNHFTRINAGEFARWRAVGQKLTTDWVQEMNAKGYAGQEMLDAARQLIAENSH